MDTATQNNPKATPSQLSQQRKVLNPDRPAWERQPGETAAQWEGFVKYRDMERRSVHRVAPHAGHWSVIWSWGHRVVEWDRHVAREEAEALVRYRVGMNERHRNLARVTHQKVVEWLQQTNPAKWSPSEALKAMEVAARLERAAAGADVADDEDVLSPEPTGRWGQQRTLGDVLGLTLGDETKFAREFQAMTRAL